jgi:regulator of cell morphogenesis and NO signaling
MSDRFNGATVGEIVAADYRAAAVFERFDIDFCCGGGRLLVDACRRAAVSPDVVEQALQSLPPHDRCDGADVASWPIDRLADHIVATHHEYVRSALPAITRWLRRIRAVHGANHPELLSVSASFDRLSIELAQHMLKEELVLFPYIRELASTRPGQVKPSPFGTVQNPIRMMEREHQEVDDEILRIRELTDGYSLPADGCSTYRVCLAELAQFESDLHRHVHLENDVLFPKAVEAERLLLHG